MLSTSCYKSIAKRIEVIMDSPVSNDATKINLFELYQSTLLTLKYSKALFMMLFSVP